MSARAGGRFTRADALLEEGMIVCVHCGSKYSKLLERCPTLDAPPGDEESDIEGVPPVPSVPPEASHVDEWIYLEKVE